jgi:hypothetical protein
MMSYQEKAADQATYLNGIDYSDSGRVMIEVGQGIIWGLLAVVEAVNAADRDR